jgi:hypothetical protein
MPWNTRLKSIVGGAQYYAKNYIENNQNTLYLKKFNVMNGLISVGSHQYMTNVSGAATEAAGTAKAYGSHSAVTFYIPVYKDMPADNCPMPTDGNSNNFLSSLSVEGCSLTPTFNASTTEYETVVPRNATSVNVSAVASDSGAKISGAGKVSLAEDVTTIKITVTATNGEVKTYTITVAKEAAIEVSGMESDVYRVGTSNIKSVPLTTDVNTFKENIKIPTDYTLKIVNSAGEEVSSGYVGTGMNAILFDKDSKEVDNKYVVVKGDVNGDGKVTSVDPLMIKRHIIGSYTLTGPYLEAADINGDGKITSVDALMLKRHIIGTYTITN